MNRKMTGIVMLAGIVIMTSGCGTQAIHNESMISAADFEKMIRVEVREIEAMPVEDVVAATN
ncbi:MAG: hypothetical protein QNJ07_04905 [Woeseiaceae bacterium]|nr:hypothetical protein [Woeseiaceae bacterium]